LFSHEIRKYRTDAQIETIQVRDGFKILHVRGIDVEAQSVLALHETNLAASIRELAVDFSQSAKQVARSDRRLTSFAVQNHIRARIGRTGEERSRRRRLRLPADGGQSGGQKLGDFLVGVRRQQASSGGREIR
jgi:hypothetical protein